MNSKAIIALNLAWLVIAAGAFYFGRSGAHEGGAAADSSPAEARRELTALPGGERPGASKDGDRNGGGNFAAGDYSTDSIGRRLAAALLDGDRIRSQGRISEILLNLNSENVGAVLEAFENGPRGEVTDRHFAEFLYAWARIDGAAAMAYVRDDDSKRRTRYGRVNAIAGWAATDSQGAMDYVATIEKGEEKQWMHYGVMGELLREDLDGAISYSELNEKSRARGRGMEKLVAAIVEQRGIDGLRDWVDGIDHLKEGGNDLLSYKQYAASVTVDRMARENPDMARDWITENADQPYLTSNGLERAARTANSGNDNELNWLVALPDLEGKRHAVGEVFEDYIRHDFAAAGNWLAAQTLGPDFDEAIQDYAYSAAREDRGAALAWAERINDPKIKSDTIKRLTPAAPTSRAAGDTL